MISSMTRPTHQRTPLSKDEGGGIARAAAMAFSTVLIIAITWNLLFPSLQEEVFEYAENQYKANDDYTDYKSTYTMIYWVVKFWPIILLVAVTIYLFVNAQNPERGSYGVRCAPPTVSVPGRI